MENKLLVIENNSTLDNLIYVNEFMANYKGEIIDFSGFRLKKTEEIIKAVVQATDIVTQTCFINGSDVQFDNMVTLLSKIPQSKNVHIAFLNRNLYDFITNQLSDEELLSINHHNIFELEFDEEMVLQSKKLDFNSIINPYLEKVAAKAKYKEEGKSRTTGRKIRILACNASGMAFKGLPIGSVVDEIDNSNADENPGRGVWVWGNGEPIKLVNDCGLLEYEIVSAMTSEDKFYEILKSIGYMRHEEISPSSTIGFITIIEDNNVDNMSKANFFCEELKIPKRTNRSIIYHFLNKTKQSETV